METNVVCELGVKRGSDAPPLAHGNNFIVVCGKDFRLRTSADNDRRPDEHRKDWLADIFESDGVFETVDLRSKGVSTDGDLEQVKSVLVALLNLIRHQDHAHARAPDRHSLCSATLDRRAQSKSLHELSNGRTLSSGNDQSPNGFEFFRSPDFDHLVCPGHSQGLNVLLKVSLNRDDSNNRTHAVESTWAACVVQGQSRLETYGRSPFRAV